MGRVTFHPGDRVLLEDNSSVQLGCRIGEGGEGCVFEIDGDPSRCIKLYNTAIPQQKSRKLQRMVELAAPLLQSASAWPLARVCSTKGRVVGFVMPRLQGFRPIHTLYTPLSRKQHFPQANWKFLVHTARNLAAAFGTVHNAGCVIGDVNQGNVWVHETTARCALIDCDSFQIRDGNQVHYCEVGVGHFTPPELQGGAHFSQVLRTPDHDAFGLAVLIFHLLFFGRHPFAGVHARREGPTLEEQIKGYYFAYSSQAGRLGVKAPPGTAPLTVLDPPTAALFEQAFTHMGPRPTPRQWLTALSQLQGSLRTCSTEEVHLYPGHLTQCPWCTLEEQTATALFVERVPATFLTPKYFDITSLWNTIKPEMRWPRSSRLDLQTLRQRLASVGALDRLERIEAQAQAVRRELRQLRDQYLQLPKAYQHDIEALQRATHATQLQKFLRLISLDRTNVPKVSPAQLKILHAHGIRSAADVEISSLIAIPGLSASLIDRLIDWRARAAQTFPQDHRKILTVPAVRAVNRQFDERKAQLEQTLLKTAQEHSALRDRYVEACKQVKQLAKSTARR